MNMHVTSGCMRSDGPIPHPVEAPRPDEFRLLSLDMLLPGSFEMIRRTVKRAGYHIGKRAADALRPLYRFHHRSGSVPLMITLVSVGTLGFPQGGYGGEVYDQADKVGLSLLPVKAAPSLAAAKVQGQERIVIATRPLQNRNGEMFLLELASGYAGPLLRATFGPIDGFWGPETVFAFAH